MNGIQHQESSSPRTVSNLQPKTPDGNMRRHCADTAFYKALKFRTAPDRQTEQLRADKMRCVIQEARDFVSAHGTDRVYQSDAALGCPIDCDDASKIASLGTRLSLFVEDCPDIALADQTIGG